MGGNIFHYKAILVRFPLNEVNCIFLLSNSGDDTSIFPLSCLLFFLFSSLLFSLLSSLLSSSFSLLLPSIFPLLFSPLLFSSLFPFSIHFLDIFFLPLPSFPPSFFLSFSSHSFLHTFFSFLLSLTPILSPSLFLVSSQRFSHPSVSFYFILI